MVKVDLQKFIEVKVTMSLAEARAVRDSLNHDKRADTFPVWDALEEALREVAE